MFVNIQTAIIIHGKASNLEGFFFADFIFIDLSPLHFSSSLSIFGL